MNKKTKIKLSLSDRIFNVVNIFIMLVIMAVMLAPIIPCGLRILFTGI